ncbi:MAG: L-threonylcarbamoyladenylate synthase [Candidatus Sungiibacteriota bacterium]
MALKIVKLTDKNRKEVLSLSERILRRGGVVIGPSDTVYGIYANATDEKAVKKIFKIKKRAPEKALPIFVKDIAAARRLAYIDDRKARFLEKVWPGPATVVFHHKEKLPRVLTGGLNTIGIRIPANPFLSELLARIDFSLAQTSANISGRAPILSIEELEGGELRKTKLVDLIVDGGELPSRSSTVVDFTRSEPAILRVGIITKKELDEALGR